MSGPSEQSLREGLLRIARQLVACGLNRGTSGNCSARHSEPDGFLITPSGIPVDDMSPDSIVRMDFSGKVAGAGKPSSEWRFHRDILHQRAEVGAVIHVHSTFATALACLRRDLPPFHYMIAVAGGDSIRCAPYALFGTQELSDLALAALEGRKACLLANHGLITLGADLDDAMAIAVEVEALCEQYLIATRAGEPALLSAGQMSAVFRQFKDYGRQATLRSEAQATLRSEAQTTVRSDSQATRPSE